MKVQQITIRIDDIPCGINHFIASHLTATNPSFYFVFLLHTVPHLSVSVSLLIISQLWMQRKGWNMQHQTPNLTTDNSIMVWFTEYFLIQCMCWTLTCTFYVHTKSFLEREFTHKHGFIHF